MGDFSGLAVPQKGASITGNLDIIILLSGLEALDHRRALGGLEVRNSGTEHRALGRLNVAKLLEGDTSASHLGHKVEGGVGLVVTP